MELTLIKTKTYKLDSFGKFALKFKTRQQHIPNIIPVGELRINHDTSMPMSPEQLKEVVKLMKKDKTDILTDGYNFYTRSNNSLVEVWHEKLSRYKSDPAFKNEVDLGHSFGKIMLNNA